MPQQAPIWAWSDRLGKKGAGAPLTLKGRLVSMSGFRIALKFSLKRHLQRYQSRYDQFRNDGVFLANISDEFAWVD